jgi:hypothetical protein
MRTSFAQPQSKCLLLFYILIEMNLLISGALIRGSGSGKIDLRSCLQTAATGVFYNFKTTGWTH